MSPRGVMRRLATALLPALLCCAQPALAGQSAQLHATLTPDRLGAATTLGFTLRIAGSHGDVPPPLTDVSLSYPSEFGVAVSGLGVETCAQTGLETFGIDACPPDSRMGHGNATVAIPIGPTTLHETANVTIVRGRSATGGLLILFFAEGSSPVQAAITLPATLMPASPPFGGSVDIALPLIPSLPEAPDVSLVRLTATLGPLGLTYYERVGGKQVAYKPRGIELPGSCPRGGFPFAVRLSFADATHTSAEDAVPCPASRR